MLKHTLLFLFITSLMFVLLGCSDPKHSKVYSHNGFSISHANNWIFSKDTNDSLFGEREIIFSLGEISFAAFYIREKQSDFTSFVDLYLKKTLPSFSQKDTKVESTERKIADHTAIIRKITSEFLGDPKVTCLYAVDIHAEHKNVYFISLIASEDKITIDDELESVINSLRLDF